LLTGYFEAPVNQNSEALVNRISPPPNIRVEALVKTLYD
jgi:hypothetical protein